MKQISNKQQGISNTLLTQLRDMGEAGREYVSYVRQHPILAMITAAVVAVCYAKQAYSLNYYIDAEIIINHPGTFYNWLDIGRFGLVFLKQLLGLSWYNPYFEAGLFLLALWQMSLSAGYLFTKLDERVSSSSIGIFSLLIIVYPNYAEQFLFRYQALEVVLGIWLLLLGNVWFLMWLRKNNKLAFVLSLIPLIISFGIYQSMVNIQLTFCLGMFLFWIYREGDDARTVHRVILGSASHFLLSFTIYEVLVQLFFSNGGYLNSQIQWRNIGFYQGLRQFLGYGLDIFLGSGAFGTSSYSVTLILLIATVFLLLWRKRTQAFWYVCGAGGLALSPFFLCILMGTRTVNRAQLMLPFACGMMWLFSCHVITELLQEAGKEKLQRFVLGLGVLLGAVLLYLQASPLMRLFYTEDIVRRSDTITAVRIIEDIENFHSAHLGKPVVFIGYREGLRNGSSEDQVIDNYLCQSAFEYDYSVDPQFYYSSHRILGFFRTLGYPYAPPTQEMMADAYERSRDMKSWPLPGSVQEFDEFIVVKLRNNNY